MLQHVRHHQVYWFCRSCWQEMPLFEQPSLNLVSSALRQQFVPLSFRRSLVTV
ncbi:MAG: hypothetical protein SFY66_27375 [Oculatellaceae cyanobacterium bins.114]|nr:hypothetical protein [Oculatellaceae cyanobacterium bins.114]